MTLRTITPNALEAARQAAGAVELIDVRTPLEFQEVHVTFARNVPLDTLDGELLAGAAVGATDPGRPLYVICRSGDRSRRACERLLAAGHREVVMVEGGTQAWDAAGLPVVRGRKAMSLERQVRIAAGSLVVLGVLLGWLVHPGFVALSGLVGAGLAFAGITDTCAMGMLLARMPWNRAGEPATRRPLGQGGAL